MINIHVVCLIELQCRHRTSLKGACSRVPTWIALSASLLGYAGLQRPRPARDDGDFMGASEEAAPTQLQLQLRACGILCLLCSPCDSRHQRYSCATPRTASALQRNSATETRFNASATEAASKMHCWTLLSFSFSTDARWCYDMK